MRKFAAVHFAGFDRKCFAAAEKTAAQVAVGIHAGVIARFVHIPAELRVDGAGMAVLVLLRVIRNHLAHNIQQVVLEVFQIKTVHIVGSFLHHHAAGGVVGRDAAGAVAYAGSRDNFPHFFGNIVKRRDPASRLKLQFFLENFKFHGGFLPEFFFTLRSVYSCVPRLSTIFAHKNQIF